MSDGPDTRAGDKLRDTDEPATPIYGEVWAFESFLGALPGISLSDRAAIATQVGLFSSAVVLLGFLYGVEQAILPGLVAVGVAGVGSAAMLRFSRGVRRLDPPVAYRRLLFGSSVEIVLTVFAFVGLVVYLLVVEPAAPGTPLLVELLGEPLPVVPTAVALLVLWDLCYRTGVAWWAAVASLWRALSVPVDPDLASDYRRLDVFNVAFALAQLALVPFVLTRPLLLLAVCGHVVAVLVVETAAIKFQQ